MPSAVRTTERSGGAGAAPKEVIHEAPKRDDRVPAVAQLAQMRLEDGRRHRHAVGG